MDEIQEVPELLMYFMDGAMSQTQLFKNKVIKLKSITVCFPITGTTLLGCCLCNKEVQSGLSVWGFKSHSFEFTPGYSIILTRSIIRNL